METIHKKGKRDKTLETMGCREGLNGDAACPVKQVESHSYLSPKGAHDSGETVAHTEVGVLGVRDGSLPCQGPLCTE